MKRYELILDLNEKDFKKIVKRAVTDIDNEPIRPHELNLLPSSTVPSDIAAAIIYLNRILQHISTGSGDSYHDKKK